MIKSAFKHQAKKSSVIRKTARWYFSKTRYFNWDKILKRDASIWNDALCADKKVKILVATSTGSQLTSMHLESLISVALTLRNADVDFLLCDSALPACMACEIGFFKNQAHGNKHNLSSRLCNTCFLPAYNAYKTLGLPVHLYSNYLADKDFEKAAGISSAIPFNEIFHYKLNGLSVGEHAMAGALRFYARGDLKGEPHAEFALRLFLKAALLSIYATDGLLNKNSFDCALFNHGIYVPQGLIGEVCRSRGVKVINWNPAYKKKCFIFSHNNTYHHTMISEPVEKWINIKWNSRIDLELMDYLKSRWKGLNDWIWFHKKPVFDLKTADNLGIDFSKPCIGMLTSVMWDAALHYRSNAFPNMLDWVLKTIEYFINRPELQLIIRIHPAEIQAGLPSRQCMADEIKKVYPGLPENIIVIPPENNISTYAVMLKCDTVIIYNTKTGIELAAMGIPVIVAGEAWIRNKGFAIDVKHSKEYFSLLDKLPLLKRMSEKNILKAKKYAYHFFFKRMIPLEFVEPASGNPPYKINVKKLNDLMPGKKNGLDVICNGIINGTDFIYDGFSAIPGRDGL